MVLGWLVVSSIQVRQFLLFLLCHRKIQMMLFTCMTAMLWAVLLNSNKCKNVQRHDKATVHNTCSRLQETIYSLGNMCVFLFFTHQAIDVLFLQCQFAPPNPTLLLPSWLLSNGPRDLIGLGCAFGHTDCDSQLVNEFSLFCSLYRENTSWLLLRQLSSI